jgi:molybdopterin-binding protein
MKLSARNVFKGRVLEVKRVLTTAHVNLEVAGGIVITSSITVEAVDELKLTKGDLAYVGAERRLVSGSADPACARVLSVLGKFCWNSSRPCGVVYRE